MTLFIPYRCNSIFLIYGIETDIINYDIKLSYSSYI